jgi:hypothetical protein
MANLRVAVMGHDRHAEVRGISLEIPDETTLGRARFLAYREAPGLFEEAGWCWGAYDRDTRYNPDAWEIGLKDRDTGQYRFGMHQRIDAIQASGEVLFNQPLADITLAEFRASAESPPAEFAFDAETFGLWSPEGRGGGGSLPLVLQLWPLFEPLIRVGLEGVAYDMMKAAVQRLLSTVSRDWHHYRQRLNAAPTDVIRLVLAKDRWSAPELARMLGGSEDSARDWLEALEFVPVPGDPQVFVRERPDAKSRLLIYLEGINGDNLPDFLQTEEVLALMASYPEVRQTLWKLGKYHT